MSSEIEITVAVSSPPEHLLRQDKFLNYMHGWNADRREAVDEPADDEEAALTIRLVVRSDLDPEWSVQARNGEQRSISAGDRARFNFYRIDDAGERHLSWTRGSALSAITGSQDEISGLLADARESARTRVFETSLPALQQAADRAFGKARELGVNSTSAWTVGLTPDAGLGRGGLALHDGRVPVEMLGVGSRRLAAAAIQMTRTGESSIFAIDEIEHGLEPYRLRRLLTRISSTDAQAFLTTHSSVAISHLASTSLRLVQRSEGDEATSVVDVEELVRRTGADAQAVVRRNAEAFLARSVIVGEGKTEVGFAWAICVDWDRAHPEEPTAHLGVAYADGGGADAPRTAIAFRDLGYRAMLVMDNDVDVDIDRGVQSFLWDTGNAIEQQLAVDLPVPAMDQLLEAASRLYSSDSVYGRLSGLLAHDNADLIANSVADWPSLTGRDLLEVRKLIGSAAKQHKWFKTVEGGEALGHLAVAYESDLADDCATSRGMRAIREFALGTSDAPAS